MKREKHIIFYGWLAFIAVALYFFFFQNDFLHAQISRVLNLPLGWRSVIFLLFGCVRGFTLIPLTYLILLGLVFLPVMTAYILTMISIMVSSAGIYYFSEYLGLAGFFERAYPKQIEKLKSILQKNELPIVIAWSFFPLAPTDLICYVCGSLRIDIKKFLVGVLIGEGVVCALYIFAGKELLLFLLHKVIGG